MSDPSVKSSWTCCAKPELLRETVGTGRRRWHALAALSLSWLLFSVGAPGAQALAQDAANINPFLGPEYASWMTGAVGAIASEAERQQFQLLESDAAAAAFVTEFWQQPGRGEIKELYDRRFSEAEKRFAEGVYPGGRSDRGAIFILYGEPESIEYEEFRDIDEPDVEIWRYPKKAERGLDGERPARQYRFVKVGDRTRRFDRGDQLDPTTRRRRIPRTQLPFDRRLDQAVHLDAFGQVRRR